MKNIHKNLIAILFLLLGTLVAFGQDKIEEIKVPLSNPGQAGNIIATAHRGQITVKGHSSNEVILRIIESEMKEDHDEDDDKGKDIRHGMKKITNQMLKADIEEINNTVQVTLDNKFHGGVEIMVPTNFSAKINTHHNGDVYVSNLNGKVEISAHHGDIKIEQISGSAVIDTHHGEIEAEFTSVDSSVPMAFTTYHGDVVVAFPSNFNASAKIKTTKGDIYTDYEMSVVPPALEINDEGRKKKVKLGGWVQGKIGSGGEEIMFSSYHGDIIIKKGKLSE